MERKNIIRVKSLSNLNTLNPSLVSVRYVVSVAHWPWSCAPSKRFGESEWLHRVGPRLVILHIRTGYLLQQVLPRTPVLGGVWYVGEDITTSGREILGFLARWVKYLPTMKLRASQCVPGMRISWPWVNKFKLRLTSPPFLVPCELTKL